MDCQFVKARGECPALFQPPQTALDHVAIAIAHRVVADRPTPASFRATPSRRDHRPDAVRPQPVADALCVIGFVAANPSRTPPGTPDPPLDFDALDQGFELGRFVRLARKEQCAERQPIAIHQQVQLGAKAAT